MKNGKRGIFLAQEKTLSCRLSAVYVLYYAGYMACFSFLSVYLSGRGFTAGQIAAVNTGTALVNFASQFWMGPLAARRSSRWVLRLCMAAALPFGLLLGLAPARLETVLAAVLPLTLFDFTSLGQLDALTLRLNRLDSRIQYSRMRALGGLSGAVLSAGLGEILARAGMGAMFGFHTGALALALLLVRTLPDGNAVSPQKTERPGAGPLSLLRLLPAGILLFAGWRVVLAFLPLLLVEQGGGSRQQGVAMALISVSTIPVLAAWPRLRRQFSLRALMGFGAAAMVLRLAGMALPLNAWELAVLQLAEGLSYGLLQPGVMELIGRCGGAGQARATAVWTGVQMAFCSLLANGLLAVWPGLLRQAFVPAAALAAVGGVWLTMTLSRNDTTEQEV